jgi:hypothetical protein
MTEDLVSIRLPNKVETLVLLDGAYKAGTMMYRPGRSVDVPEGEYRLLSYQLRCEDEQGDLWRLTARGTKNSALLTVRRGSQSAFAIGEPFRPLVGVRELVLNTFQGRGGPAQLFLELRGRGDEMVSELTRIRGNKTRIPMSGNSVNRPKEPTFKVVKEDGEVVRQGQFEYG